MTRGINAWVGGKPIGRVTLDWDTRQLAWVVREPFASRFSQAELVAGLLEGGESLVLESLMPEGGAIFSDGIEADYLDFNSGTSVRIQVAKQQAQIVVPSMFDPVLSRSSVSPRRGASLGKARLHKNRSHHQKVGVPLSVFARRCLEVTCVI